MSDLNTENQEPNVPLNAESVQQALLAMQRAQKMKRIGLLTVSVLGQIALGAAGCMLVLKIRDRKVANDNTTS